MKSRTSRALFLAAAFACLPGAADIAGAADTTYYVSSSAGDDAFDGLSEARPLRSLTRVNQLALGAGDRVLLRCGDTWRAEMLVVTASGTADEPIAISSYPEGCQPRPILSGAQPISGWVQHAASVFAADLSAGANSGLFALGINQLFRLGQRLPLGRWPNLDAPGGGYAFIDSSSQAPAQISDAALPAGDWTGAIAHIKGMRWYMMNREVTAASGSTLSLNADIYCYTTGDCTGWGYFLNSHLATLDAEGEWYYDSATNVVYLYTLLGAPADGAVAGSVILSGAGSELGAVILGRHAGEHVANVVIENLDIRGWFAHGITAPEALELDDNQHVAVRSNAITDVDGTGIRMSSWVWNAGAASGWRGGRNLQVLDNVVDGANEYGIRTHVVESTIAGNTVRNVGLIENLGRAGMGCGFDTTEACTINGSGIFLDIHLQQDSYQGNTVERNQIRRVAMGGIDTSSAKNELRMNFVEEACFAKADCGGIRGYGLSSLEQTSVYDVVVDRNIVVDTIGNTDGCSSAFSSLFGFGIYFDHYSRDIAVTGNTVLRSSAGGILFWWRSTGTITGNTAYANAYEEAGGGNAQIAVWDYEGVELGTQVTLSDNATVGVDADQKLVRISSPANLVSAENNDYFNPFTDELFERTSDWRSLTLAEWQPFINGDWASRTSWFTQAPGEEPRSRIFYNESEVPITVDLGPQAHVDLGQRPVPRWLQIEPYRSRVVIQTDEVAVPSSSALVLAMLAAVLGLLGSARHEQRVSSARAHVVAQRRPVELGDRCRGVGTPTCRNVKAGTCGTPQRQIGRPLREDSGESGLHAWRGPQPDSSTTISSHVSGELFLRSTKGQSSLPSHRKYQVANP